MLTRSIARLVKVWLSQSLVFIPSSSPASATRGLSYIPDMARWHLKCQPQVRLRLRHNPELNCQVCTATTVNDRDTSSFDSARIDEIVLSAVATLLRFTSTATVDDDRCLPIQARSGAG
jgi:hypothetical protein